MSNFRTIWQHELRQTNQIADNLIKTEKVKFGWKVLALPVFAFNYARYRKRLRVLRKNLIFTKQLAFKAAQNIFQGKERAWEIRQIEIKTNEILDKEKKGYYTEKIRRKQIVEVELLIDHYLKLIDTKSKKYSDMLTAKYPSKGAYLSFLHHLRKAEEEVIQTAIATMRKGTKKERRLWFDRVRQTTKEIRMQEADKIYSK